MEKYFQIKVMTNRLEIKVYIFIYSVIITSTSVVRALIISSSSFHLRLTSLHENTWKEVLETQIYEETNLLKSIPLRSPIPRPGRNVERSIRAGVPAAVQKRGSDRR